MKDLSNENIIQFGKNGVSYLQFRKLNEYNQYIRHAYSLGKELNYKTRAGNRNLSENEIEKAILAYEKLCKNIDIEPINIVKANQKHTANVKVAREKINKDKRKIFVTEKGAWKINSGGIEKNVNTGMEDNYYYNNIKNKKIKKWC